MVEEVQYDLLNNKEWLYKKYVKEKLSTKDIKKLCGAKTSNSVRQALIRNNIKVRNVSEGLTCNRINDGFILNVPVIEGSLLGDARLGIYNRKSDISNPYFSKKNIGKDHGSGVENLSSSSSSHSSSSDGQSSVRSFIIF